MPITHRVLLLMATFATRSLAQVLTDMCYWTSPRAASIKGGLYVNGGQWLDLISSPGIQGFTYFLNYSESFNTTGNIGFSSLFTGPTAAGLTTSYVDGIMFADEDEYYLYGYVQYIRRKTFTYISDSGAWSEAGPSVPPNRVVGYEFTSTTSTHIGPHNVSLVDNSTSMNISNYISNGAGVNVPSESLGFYFSGATAPNRSQIDALNSAHTAMYLTNSMIQINMSTPGQPTALNLTLPNYVPPRANAEMVWIPVSSQGILIAIGGVTNLTTYDIFTNISETGPSINFMASLSIYDIASQTWFSQETSGGPPSPRTQFCAITTNATNSSSFEIFIFGGNSGNSSNTILGGYTGNSTTATSFGDVWTLSVPSFTWTQAAISDSGTHNRDSHVCVRPYPDQMFVIGGENSGNVSGCVTSTIDVFNLTNSTWMDFYDPTIRSEYQIPSAVMSNIAATPTASNINSSLLALFQQPYQNHIPTCYPV